MEENSLDYIESAAYAVGKDGSTGGVSTCSSCYGCKTCKGPNCKVSEPPENSKLIDAIKEVLD